MVVPFLPFSKDEQALIAHKYLLDLAASLRHPKLVQQNQLIGQINLRFRKETVLCRSLASKDYHAETGARSLESAVKRRVRNLVVGKYFEGSISADNHQVAVDYVVDVDSEGTITIFKE